MTPDGFFEQLNVDQQTRERLLAFDRFFVEKAAFHNLVARSTLQQRWHRHYLDSAQLFTLLKPDCHTLLDIGSGGGFPGLILAALGVQIDLDVTLVESTGKKCDFLREAGEVMDLKLFHVKQCRIETLSLEKKPDVITARALASLDRLCEYVFPLVGSKTHCLFQKGARGLEELALAEKKWTMQVETHQSVTSNDAMIFDIKRLKRNQ